MDEQPAKPAFQIAAEMLKPENRRRHPRIVMSTPVTVHEIDEQFVIGPAFSAQAQDLSRSGLGLTTRRMIHNQRTLAVIFRLPGKPADVYFGVAQHVRYASEGEYHVGVEFSSAPANADVAQWLESVKAA